ncbi:MAG: aminopeptidase [bacterium]
MFSADELSKYADILVWGITKARSGKFEQGDKVVVRFDLAALPLAEVLHAKILAQGMHPILRLSPTPRMEKDFFSLSQDFQLTYLPDGEEELYENLNGSISLLAPESLTHLSGVDPKKIGTAIVARKKLREILEQREQAGNFGWSLCLLPTPELAEKAGLSQDEYKQEIVQACYLDSPDPIREWERIYSESIRIKTWLNSLEVKRFKILSKNIDLTVVPGDLRRWLGTSGHNIPSFEIFTSPDWRGTEGVFYADQPSYRSGNLVQGVRLVFEGGSVREVTAEKGEAFVREQLEMDKGANKVGEFSLTDKRFSRIGKFMAHTLYDENFGGEQGNCHIAVGASYADTFSGPQSELTKERKKELGFNDSALHWDLVNTEQKQVVALLASGKEQVIYQDGVFLP